MGGLLLALFTACHANAEESRLSIRTIAVDKGEMPVWYLATGDESYTEVNWPVEQPTAPVVSTAAEELLLFSKEVNAEGEVEFKVDRKLAVPEGSNDVLILAWRDDGDEEISLMLAKDDLKHAKFNDWLVFNTSKQVVTMRYGADGEAIQMEPSEAKPYRIDAEMGKGNSVTAQAMVKDNMRTIYSTYWPAPGNQRSLLLFFNKDNQVKLRRVIDPLPHGK